MKTFILNLTKILPTNQRSHAEIIVGVDGCLVLLIAEAVHIQSVVTRLATEDQAMLREVIRPLTQRYDFSRYLLLIVAIAWSIYEYKATKKKLGL